MNAHAALYQKQSFQFNFVEVKLHRQPTPTAEPVVNPFHSHRHRRKLNKGQSLI